MDPQWLLGFGLLCLTCAVATGVVRSLMHLAQVVLVVVGFASIAWWAVMAVHPG